MCLRNTTKEFLLEYTKDKAYQELCEELMNGTLQKTMLPKLKKVYPLSFCDLRVFETKELQHLDTKKILAEAIEEKKKEETQQTQEEPEENIQEETTEKNLKKTKKKTKKE